MTVEVVFSSNDASFAPDFRPYVNVSDGGYEKGYAVGYKDGVESRFPIEDSLLDKSLSSYHNERPVTIGNRFFSYCYNLTDVHLPCCVGLKEYAFVFCTKLPRIVLPEAKEIGPFALQSCTMLTEADFGAADSLQSNLFTNSNISILVLRRTDRITYNNSTAVFHNTPMGRGEGWIYVPRALIDEYREAHNWSTYAAQFRPLEDYTVDGTVTGALDRNKV